MDNQELQRLYKEIGELREADSVDEANILIKSGWFLVWIYTKVRPTDTPGIYSQHPVFVMAVKY